MPCYDPPNRDTRGSSSFGEDSTISFDEHNVDALFVEILRIRLDTRVDMLCRTLSLVKENNEDTYNLLPKDILDWHVKHIEWDKSRKE